MTMLLKISVVFVSPALIADPDLGMTKSQFGSIMAAGSLGGVLGKFFFGWFADRFGGKVAFLVSLVLIAGGITLFGFASHVVVFVVSYFLVNFAKSAGWASFAKLVANWYRPNQYGRVWGFISTSSRIGAIEASLIFGALLYVFNWHQVLLTAGAIGGVTILFWYLLVKEQPDTPISKEVKTIDANGEETVKPKPPHRLSRTTLKDALLIFVKSKRVWLMVLCMCGTTIQADFLNFVPILAKETLKLSSAKASMTTSAFPIGAFISLLVVGYIYDKVKPRTITKIMGITQFIAALCLGTMIMLSAIELTEDVKLIVFFTSIFIYGFSVAPAYYLPMSIFSVKFGGKHSGILISILDSNGLAASMLFSIAAGIIADQVFGWNQVLILLTLITLLTMIVLVIFLKGEAKIEEEEGRAII